MSRHSSPGAVVIAALCVACAGPPPRPYAWVSNGGVGPRAAGCDEPALRIEDGAVRALAPPLPDCGAVASLASDVGAAYAFAQVRTAASPAGPIVSNQVALGLLGLSGGAGQRGLAGGAGQRGLASSAGQRELASGAGQRELAGGAGQQELAGGAGQRELASGAEQRELAGGATQRALDAGASERALAAGAAERPQWRLVKRVSPETVGAGATAEFTLTFFNDGPAEIQRLVIVDRVSPALRIVEAPGARAYALPDGSTLLVWDDREPLAGRRRRAVRFRVSLAEP